MIDEIGKCEIADVKAHWHLCSPTITCTMFHETHMLDRYDQVAIVNFLYVLSPGIVTVVSLC